MESNTQQYLQKKVFIYWKKLMEN